MLKNIFGCLKWLHFIIQNDEAAVKKHIWKETIQV